MITPELLEALLSPENDANGDSPRARAEAYLQTLSIVERTQSLLQVLMKTQQEAHWMLTAVLLRRDIANLAGNVLANVLDTATSLQLLKGMMEPLLAFFLNTAVPANIRRLGGHCLAELCASLSILSPYDSDAAFENILSKIAPMCKQSDVLALRLLTALLDRAPLSLGRTNAMQELPALLDGKAIGDATALEATIEAICYAAIASESTEQNMGLVLSMSFEDLVLDSSSQAAQVGTLLLPFLEQLPRFTAHHDAVSAVMRHFIYTATSSPSCLAGDLNVFNALVHMCLTIANQDDPELRLSALQTLSSITSVADVKRKMLNTPRGEPFRQMLLGEDGVIYVCARLCVGGVDDDIVEGWSEEPASLMEEAIWESDEPASHAESLLGAFLENIGGGEQSLPVVLPLVEDLLNSRTWRRHRAALSILEQCLFAAPATFSTYSPVAFQAAIKLASSPAVRVQYQALSLLGGLCEQDGNLSLRRQHGGEILETMSRLVESPVSKVSAMACVALMSFCRGGDDVLDRSQVVVPYVGHLLSVLSNGPLSAEIAVGNRLDEGALTTQVRAIGVIACLAEAARENFVPYYSNIVPALFACARLEIDRAEISKLRGAAVETITIIGLSIGPENKDVFIPDAELLMRVLLPCLSLLPSFTAREAEEKESIPMDQVLSACARIATVVEEKYGPFIEIVLPHLLKRLQADDGVSFKEGNQQGLEATRQGAFGMNTNDETETMTVSIPGKGLTEVTLNIGSMEEKAQACQAIIEHANALGATFGPHVPVTLSALVPLITFTYSAAVRSTAAQATAAVYQCACLQGEEIGMSLPSEYLPDLCTILSEQIANEDVSDPETRFALADSLSDVLYYTYRSIIRTDRRVLDSFTTQIAHQVTEVLMRLILACLHKRARIIETLDGSHGVVSGEDEQIRLAQTLQKEKEVLTPLVDSVGYSLKFLKEAFVPVFDELVAPALGPYLTNKNDTRGQFAAICLFDDVLEHCGKPAAYKYAAQLAEGVIKAIGSNVNGGDSDVVQVALYGLAQIARHGPPTTLTAHGHATIYTILPIASISKESVENRYIVENAASALASMVLIGEAPLAMVAAEDKAEILTAFVSQLPLREDEDEAKICHDGFCDLVESGSIPVDLKAVLRIIGETMSYIADGEDLALPETQFRFARILRRIQKEVPKSSMEKVFHHLSAEAQGCIKSLFNEYSRHSASVVTP